MTLYCWKMPSSEEARSLPVAAGSAKSGEFAAVQVVKRRTGLRPSGRNSMKLARTPRLRRSPTATVKTAVTSPMTVTVVLPNGIRLEGLSFEQSLQVAKLAE